MTDRAFKITQLEENEAVQLEAGADATDDLRTFTVTNVTGTHRGVIAEGDIASLERVMLLFVITTAGAVTIKAGDYGPGIQSSRGDIALGSLAIGTHVVVVESSRVVSEDGEVAWTGVAAGSLAVLAMPRATAGRTGQPGIPANPRAY